MKSLSDGELLSLVEQLQGYKSARLQACFTQNKKVALQFFYQSKVFWWIIVLEASCPRIVFWDKERLNLKNSKKPIHFFIHSHFESAYLENVEYMLEYGRVIKFHFIRRNYETLEMEIRLFPHGQNILLQADDKSIAFHKPKALAPKHEIALMDKIDFDWKEWSKAAFGSVNTSKEKKNKWNPEKEISKRNKLLKKLQVELDNKKSIPIAEVAAGIQKWQKNPENIAELPFLNAQAPWHENMQIAFEQAKKVEKKIAGLEERIQHITTEIQSIEQGEVFSSTQQQIMPKIHLDKSIKYRSKTFSGQFKAYVGKNARDNMALLRKAKPWFLWMHLKDQPGCHLIAEKNKNQGIEDLPLEDLALFLYQEGMGKRDKPGNFRVQVSECRYIRPIKGDKLGRVIVQKEKVFDFFKH